MCANLLQKKLQKSKYMGEMENAYNMLVVIGKGKGSIEIARCTWKDIQWRIVENMTLSFSFQKGRKRLGCELMLNGVHGVNGIDKCVSRCVLCVSGEILL